MEDPTVFAEKPDRFTIRWNSRYGSVLIELMGFWTMEDVHLFYPIVGTALDRSRARHGHALALFDTTNNQIMSSTLLQQYQANGPQYIGMDDRVAVVFASSLLKLQMKRVGTVSENTEYFVSRAAAETWLHAHVHVRA